MPTRFLFIALTLLLFSPPPTQAAPRKPNIIYIMLDELGYFELSLMGNEHLLTPNIDKMASEGIRFTQALSGSCVCGPTRSVLMTGQHSGHTTVRANGGGMPLRAGEPTIASMLKAAGYATGGFGKWGLGDRGTTGVPETHGFDDFFGYYHQIHAHTYYPPFLLHNSKVVNLPGNTGDPFNGQTFAHDLIYERSIDFIKQNKDRPFFLYLPWTPPHGHWNMPKDDPSWQLFKDKDWSYKNQRGEHDAHVYAAMVHMVDRQVGEIFDLLKKLNLDNDTIVFFCGDNGGQHYFKNDEHPVGFFQPNRDVFRDDKGSLYEGGLRIPMIVRWPGKIKPNTVSDLLWYFPDVMPTLAQIADAKLPPNRDGLSVLPTLIGEKAAGQSQQQHQYLYWEYGQQTAVRMKNWKAIQPKKNAPWELYNLNTNTNEQNNIAAQHPNILTQMQRFATEAHTPNVVGKTLDPSLAYKISPGHVKGKSR